MDFFYLAHGVLSYKCLEDLIIQGCKPVFAAVHKEYEYDKLKNLFFDKVEALCSRENIELFKIKSINELKENISFSPLGICVGYMEIIKRDIFELPVYGILNLHCGKLPQYRGRAPICRTIMNGDKELYLTLHKIDEGVDSGDILFELPVKITDDDDVNTLYGKCENESANTVSKCIEEIKSGKAVFRKQNADKNTKANKKLTDEELRINWNDSSIKTGNKIRALIPPYPGAYSTHNGVKFLFTKAEAIEISDVNEYVNGEIIDFGSYGMNIKCGKGILKVLEISDTNLNPVHLKDTFSSKGIFI